MGNRTGLREREREREREKWSDFGIPPRLRRKRGEMECFWNTPKTKKKKGQFGRKREREETVKEYRFVPL